MKIKSKRLFVLTVVIFVLAIGSGMYYFQSIAKTKPIQPTFSTYWPTLYTYLLETVENF